MITLIIVCSLFIIGLHYSFQFDLTAQIHPVTLEKETIPINKEIAWFVKYYLHVALNGTRFHWLLKPLCDCPVCMVSVYGSIFYWAKTYWYLDEITLLTFIKWPVMVVATAGLNRALWKFLVS